jgi:WD40 repeat protein
MLQTIGENVDLHAQWPALPFPGLRPFQSTENPDESLIFYGRNREKDEILARLNAGHVVFVVGPSGCGKSSLVKVGVLPALEAGLLTRAGSNWRIAEVRPGDRPLRNLATALATFAPEAASRTEYADDVFRVLSKEYNGLWLIADNAAPRAKSQPLLLVIDQFEEIFGSQVTAPDECRQLLDAIISFAAKPHPNMYLITTMRTDFLGRCSNFPMLADVINTTLFVTPVLRDEDLKSVIVMPIEDYHGSVEPPLVETMIDDASSELGYNPDHLPLLQHALLWLWNQSLAAAGLAASPPNPNTEPPPRPLVVSRRLYADHSGLKGILNEHANTIYKGLNGRQQRIAETMFRRISERDSENRYRRSPTALDAIAKLAACAPAELKEITDKFSHRDASFLECRPLADGAGELVDLSHESLIRQWDRLRTWADEEAEKFRRFRDMSGWAAEWRERDHSDDYLKSGGEIEIYEQWWEENRPDVRWAERYAPAFAKIGTTAEVLALTEQFLARSRRQHDDNVRRHWLARLVPIAAVAILMIAGGWIFAYFQTTSARELKHQRDQFLFARAEDYLEQQGPTPALLVALSAPTDDRELERLAYSMLQSQRARVVLQADNQFPTASFSPDGRVLLYSTTNSFTFWDLAARRAVDDYSPHNVNPRVRSKWSEDGNWIVSANASNQTVLWAPCSRPNLRDLFPQCDGLTEDRTQMVFSADRPSWPSILSPNSRYLLSGGWGAQATLWKLGDHQPAPTPLRVASAGFALAFDKTSRFFAVGAANGSVQIRSVDHPEEPVITLSPSDRRTPATPEPQTDAQDQPERQIVVPVSSVAFSPADPDRLAVGTNDGMVTLWDWRTKTVVDQHSIKSNGWINVAFDPAGRVIAVTSQAGMIYLWTPGVQHPTEIRGHRQAAWLVEFNKASPVLVTASSESVRIWNMRSALAPYELEAVPRFFGVATIGGSAQTLTLQDAERRKTTTVKWPDHKPRPLTAAVAEDGQQFVVADGASIDLYVVGDSIGEPIAKFRAPSGKWQKVGFLHNPDLLVGQTTEGRFYAWPYFRDLNALRGFAMNVLPVDDQGLRAALTDLEKCRLGILPREFCPHAKMDDADASTPSAGLW